MIYHYDNLPAEALRTSPPVGWDLPVLLARDYDSQIMLATICLNIGYFIGVNEGSKNELATGRKNEKN